jgi:hypothetical protein
VVFEVEKKFEGVSRQGSITTLSRVKKWKNEVSEIEDVSGCQQSVMEPNTNFKNTNREISIFIALFLYQDFPLILKLKRRTKEMNLPVN